MGNSKLTATAIARELNNSGKFSVDPAAITWIEESAMKNQVADATSKFIVPINGNDEGVFILSSAFSPHSVQRAVDKLNKVRDILGKEARRVVLVPLQCGTVNKLSYAFWQRHEDLSTSRIVRMVQKKLLTPKVFKWLRYVCSHSIDQNLSKEQLKNGFYDPLQNLAANDGLSDGLRRAADTSFGRLKQGLWAPSHVVQHSDLWLGNFLLPKRKSEKGNHYGFYVIDWGGSLVEGYPYADLVRFAMSAGSSKRQIRSEIEAHSIIVKGDPSDVYGSTVAALGHLGMNLDQFPQHRYHMLCENIYEFLCETGFEQA